ncbi:MULTISPECIES: formylglycine-generating enzyme family protein [Rahnella]|uniref:formylglycine-generating enzyme family protein n=1 Tax=Rahnella TaxID=34037 RepID=UPI0013EECE93|nr:MULTISPECIES: SUMF1/EgtB/PvdO family nonheme iron enzyme [Rahnella]MBU9823855.1 SUMF1/EgtB/PvdO family nonheme iron enzyme [Rahnella perminowiae]
MRNFKPPILAALILSLIGCDRSDEFITKTLQNMVFVQGGTFEMGDVCLKKYGQRCVIHNDNASLPVHDVTLDGFYMAKYKVTYRDYDFYTSANKIPKLKISEGFLKRYPNLRNADYPATANWQLSSDYCQWLANKTNLPFSLPTEAQWEYAARNRGQDIIYGTVDGHLIQGKTVPGYEQRKQYAGFAAGLYPVGQFSATPLGLYDMAGNGQEWMLDWYSKTYYQNSSAQNPVGPVSGNEKSLRGFPAGDSVDDDATPTATTMFRTGKDPLLKDLPPDLWDKFNGDIEKATEADTETDPYKIAERGFVPKITFRCVINVQSLPEKYR